MNKKLAILSVSTILSAAFLSGCGTMGAWGSIKDGYSVDITGKTFKATKASEVTLSYSDAPKDNLHCDKYQTIGQISVDPSTPMGFDRSISDINAYFKKGAAKEGGDAVININKSIEAYSGYIVKCQ